MAKSDRFDDQTEKMFDEILKDIEFGDVKNRKILDSLLSAYVQKHLHEAYAEYLNKHWTLEEEIFSFESWAEKVFDEQDGIGNQILSKARHDAMNDHWIHRTSNTLYIYHAKIKRAPSKIINPYLIANTLLMLSTAILTLIVLLTSNQLNFQNHIWLVVTQLPPIFGLVLIGVLGFISVFWNVRDER